MKTPEHVTCYHVSKQCHVSKQKTADALKWKPMNVFFLSFRTNQYLSVLHTEGINIKSHDEFIFWVIFAFWCLFYEFDTLSRVSLYSVWRAKHATTFGRPWWPSGTIMQAKRAFFYSLLRPVYQRCAKSYLVAR